MPKIVYTVDLFKKIPNLEEKILLDVGTGPHLGYSDAYFRVLYETGKDPEELEKLAENVCAIDLKIPDYTPVAFLRADAIYLPFNNESFDIIALGNILNLYYSCDFELEKIIEGSRRVLRPNGYLIGKATLYGIIDQLRRQMFYGPRKIQTIKYETLIGKYFKFLEKGTTLFIYSRTPFDKAFYFLAQRR